MNRIPRWTAEFDGRTYEAETATVESFHLGVEDHGCFVAEVGFTGPGWGQGLPVRPLDSYDPNDKERHGTAFGCDFIMEIIKCIGSPEQAAGRQVVIFRGTSGSFIEGFAAMKDDGSFGEPFFPNKLVDKYFPEKQ